MVFLHEPTQFGTLPSPPVVHVMHKTVIEKIICLANRSKCSFNQVGLARQPLMVYHYQIAFAVALSISFDARGSDFY